jgi:hypothetical protein
MPIRRRIVHALVPFAIVTATSLCSLAAPRHITPIPPHRDDPGGHHETAPGSPWTPLTNRPTFGAANPILLTDGTVLVQSIGSPNWWKLTPDQNGSYVNGTWTQIASLPSGYAPLYYSSAVLPDGRFIIEGGEYNFFALVWTNLGAIYDPLADTWTPVDPPAGWGSIGDAEGVVLADGTYMLANCCSSQAALFNAQTLTWTPTGFNKADWNNEQGWTLLPDGDVLTVDTLVTSYNDTNSELYDPSTGSWQGAGSTVVQLWDSKVGCGLVDVTYEVGPAVLRPDGTVFATGADTCPGTPGNTAIYDSKSGNWSPGPTFPGSLNMADAPAALEPNGNVLMMASPGYDSSPSTFLEWNGRSLTEIAGPPDAPFDPSYVGNMLVLPTGQILLTDFSSDIEIYTPIPGYRAAWAPAIERVHDRLDRGSTYEISGRRFNGMSQGAAYGDDTQAATNYPLVRITMNKTKHIFYCRTHDHSSMAVASNDEVYTYFEVPDTMETGEGKLEVVANGIPSEEEEVRVR